MRILNISNSNKKKIRWAKRKCRAMVRELTAQAESFPEIKGTYWHVHAPVAQSFIEWEKKSRSIKKLFVQTYVDCVQHLIDIKPVSDVPLRVVALIKIPWLFACDITIFFWEEYFNGFFNRNDDYQKWQPLETNRNIAKELNLKIPDEFKIRGYRETIVDDNLTFESEIWAIGEL